MTEGRADGIFLRWALGCAAPLALLLWEREAESVSGAAVGRDATWDCLFASLPVLIFWDSSHI